MNLYVNGCSHTHGTKIALKNKLEDAYPYLLANYYKAELINDSGLGASNDRIMRTTIEAVLSSPIPFDKVVIQFTHMERFEGIIDDDPYNLPIFKNDKKHYDISNKKIEKLLSHKLLNEMYMLECLFVEHAITDYRFIVWRSVDSEYITYKHLNKSKIIFNARTLLNKEFEVCKHPHDKHYEADAHQKMAEWIIQDYSALNEFYDYNPLEHVYT